MLYYLGLYFVVQELLLEFGQGVVSAVIVQVQRVQHIPEEESRVQSLLVTIGIFCTGKHRKLGFKDVYWINERTFRPTSSNQSSPLKKKKKKLKHLRFIPVNVLMASVNPTLYHDNLTAQIKKDEQLIQILGFFGAQR